MDYTVIPYGAINREAYASLPQGVSGSDPIPFP